MKSKEVRKFRMANGEYAIGYILGAEGKNTVAILNNGTLVRIPTKEAQKADGVDLGNIDRARVQYMKSKENILKEDKRYRFKRMASVWMEILEKDSSLRREEVVRYLDEGMKKFGYTAYIPYTDFNGGAALNVEFNKKIEFGEELGMFVSKARLLGYKIQGYGYHRELDRLIEKRLREVGYFRYLGRNKMERMDETIVVGKEYITHWFQMSAVLLCTMNGVEFYLRDLMEMCKYEVYENS